MKPHFLVIKIAILFSVFNTAITNKVYCQRIYLNENTKRNVIYLGAYNDKNELRVYDRNKIVYINKNNLKQIDQLSAKQFLDTISKYKLSFLCKGSEPFWEMSLNKNELIIFADNKKSVYNVDVSSTKDNRFRIMFKSKDGKVYGMIQKTIEGCTAAVTEVENTFECTIYAEGNIYIGCGLVGTYR